VISIFTSLGMMFRLVPPDWILALLRPGPMSSNAPQHHI
jgi:hypothetical protein